MFYSVLTYKIKEKKVNKRRKSLKFKNQDQLLDAVKKAVHERSHKEEQIAAFDADGTLWQEDANQILLDYQIVQEKQLDQKNQQKNQTGWKKQTHHEKPNSSVRLVTSAVPKKAGIELEKREELKKQSETNSELETQLENQFIRSNNQEFGKFSDLLSDCYQKYHRHELCESFLKKQAGLSFAEFQDQSEKALAETPLTVFPFQRELLAYLNKQGLKIVVITASIQWLVELAVKKCDLPVDQVIGCHTELELSQGLRSHLEDLLNLKGIAEQSLILKNFCLLESKESKRLMLSQSEIKKREEGESEGGKQQSNQTETQKQIELSRAELENLEPFDFKKELNISDRIVRPSTGKDSKGEVFLKEYAENSCFLAAGNTRTDLPLLELARLPFVVHSAEKNNIIFPAEQKMKELALTKKWLIFEKEKSV